MPEIVASIDSSEISRLVREAPKIIFRHWRKGFFRIGSAFEKRLVATRLRGRPGLFRRSGMLARRLGPPVVVGKELEDLSMKFPAGTKYARIHEYGGVIVARGKKLAIPLGPAKTAAGVARGRPRSFPNLQLISRKGKHSLLARVNKKNITPFFVLVPRVVIRARFGFRAAWKAELPNLVPAILNRATHEAAEEAATRSARGGRRG